MGKILLYGGILTKVKHSFFQQPFGKGFVCQLSAQTKRFLLPGIHRLIGHHGNHHQGGPETIASETLFMPPLVTITFARFKTCTSLRKHYTPGFLQKQGNDKL